jgi:tetratricopeptide (TPR) repeat protein
MKLRLLFIALGLAAGAQAQDVPGCGSLQNHYGPFDYRTEKYKLTIVEVAHFTPPVEALLRGSSSDYVGDDLSYTLRTSPNHHRALVAATRFAERSKTDQPFHLQYSVQCYYERAVRFKPDDTVVRALYAQYLNRRGRTSEALAHLAIATGYAKENALSHYNLGLVYFELKAYAEALQQAHTAMSLGMAPGTLGDQLKKAGQWREPPPQPAPDAASAAAGPGSAASAAR